MKGGEDRSWYRLLTPEGKADRRPDVIGNYTGQFEALNVHNAQPDTEYYYERRNANSLQAARNRGWRRVTPEDPERMGQVEEVGMSRGSNLDTMDHAFSDIVLMKTSTENYRRLANEQMEENKARLEGATEAYLGGAGHLEDRFGPNAEGPLRWKRPRHGNRIGSLKEGG